MNAVTIPTSSNAAGNNPIFQTPISKEEDAYRRIKAFLFGGSLVPGQKIIYRDLENLLGMSKTPIVGALARLDQEGLVVLEHNRGYYVKQLDPSEIRQLYELRIRMEEIAVEYAIDNAQAEDLAQWRVTLEAYLDYDCVYYDAKRLQLDLEFHLQIARMGGNKYLVVLLMKLYEQTRVGMPAAFMSPFIPLFKEDHIQIFKSLEARDAVLAKKLIRIHELRACVSWGPAHNDYMQSIFHTNSRRPPRKMSPFGGQMPLPHLKDCG